jgi:hypothetical protein
MHLQDLDGMKGVMDRVENHPKISYSDLTFDKWNLYRAYYHYMCKEYDYAFKLLQKQSSLLKDSTGWLASYKLLEIYILIAQKNYDLIDFRIAAYHKLIQRHKEKESRLKLIADILQSWKKHEYNFESAYQTKKAELEKLAAKKGPLAFKALGSEIIPFHIWFTERSKQKATKES